MCPKCELWRAGKEIEELRNSCLWMAQSRLRVTGVRVSPSTFKTSSGVVLVTKWTALRGTAENCATQWFPGLTWVFSCSINLGESLPKLSSLFLFTGSSENMVAMVIPTAMVGHAHPRTSSCLLFPGPSQPLTHCYGNCKFFPANASKGWPWNRWPSTSHRWPGRSWSHMETQFIPIK